MEEKINVAMTPEQQRAFEAFQKSEEHKKKMAQTKKQREELQSMTDESLAKMVPQMIEMREQMSELKKRLLEEFRTVMELRREISDVNDDQNSFMFTDRKGEKRIRIGWNVMDGYLDDVEVGITKVKNYLGSLAKDEESARLVQLVMQLLSRNQQGQLKASRILQLSRIANESGNEDFIDGVHIIQESYRPTRSAMYIKCYTKEEGETWNEIPLDVAGA